ncbi:hypothetical protein [Stenotrophomonas maltophilia]|uniref:hypothetical protein n=1 Tax=Stenotrophomonas maltophilia TaxID=40324 RepID=UPI0039C1D264
MSSPRIPAAWQAFGLFAWLPALNRRMRYSRSRKDPIMRLCHLMTLALLPLFSQASPLPPAHPQLASAPDHAVEKSIIANVQLYLALLLYADPGARRTLDAQWQGTFQTPGYLDRLQALKARLGDDTAIRSTLESAGVAAPAIGEAALNRLGRVSCELKAVRFEATNSSASAGSVGYTRCG